MEQLIALYHTDPARYDRPTEAEAALIRSGAVGGACDEVHAALRQDAHREHSEGTSVSAEGHP